MKLGPWYFKPKWRRYAEFGFWRFISYWAFAVDLVRWLLLNGYADRQWFGTDGRPSWSDSERIHLEIVWASCIGQADLNCGRYGEMEMHES